MAKSNHHYVPKFYLNHFASAPRRINLLHIGRELLVPDASIKGQCYRKKLYGKTDEMEDILAQLEGAFSTVIRRIISQTAGRFELDEKEFGEFLVFIAIQATRTLIAEEKIVDGIDKLFKLYFREDAKAKGIDLSKVTVGPENPVFWAMRNAHMIVETISDLVPHLLINITDTGFLTSDNPVVQYNQYCEKTHNVGRTGFACRGLQIFCPLSPSHMVMLYDSAVYRAADQASKLTYVTRRRDVASLNLLTCTNADQVVLFADRDKADQYLELARQSRDRRPPKGSAVSEFVSETNPNRSLIHFAFPSTNIDLDLTFLELRRKARAVPLNVRVAEFRDRPPPSEFPPIIGGEEFRRKV